MSTYEYVGARYVPIFADPVEWDINRAYEALTIVTYNNDCYTSKIPVPVGTQITNTTYWMNSSNFNTKIAELFSKFPVSIQDGGTGASTAAGARTNLDVAQNDGASITLYDAEQNEADLIAKVGNVNVASDGSLQSQIDTLQDLMSNHGMYYSYGNVTVGYLPTSHQFVINFWGRFTDENNVTYERAQLSFNRQVRKVIFHAQKTDGTWVDFID